MMFLHQLVAHVAQLQQELEKERSESQFFRQERDRIHTFWTITKERLQESEATVKNKDCEKEEVTKGFYSKIKV